MKCEDFQKQISRLIDKELPASSSGALLNHLQACTKCLDFYDKTIEINQVLNSAQVVAQNSALAQRIKDKITQKRRGIVGESVPTFWKRAPVYALVALLAVGVGNIAGKTLTQAILSQNPETNLELMIPNGTEYVSDIFSDMSQGEATR